MYDTHSLSASCPLSSSQPLVLSLPLSLLSSPSSMSRPLLPSSASFSPSPVSSQFSFQILLSHPPLSFPILSFSRLLSLYLCYCRIFPSSALFSHFPVYTPFLLFIFGFLILPSPALFSHSLFSSLALFCCLIPPFYLFLTFPRLLYEKKEVLYHFLKNVYLY